MTDNVSVPVEGVPMRKVEAEGSVVTPPLLFLNVASLSRLLQSTPRARGGHDSSAMYARHEREVRVGDRLPDGCGACGEHVGGTPPIVRNPRHDERALQPGGGVARRGAVRSCAIHRGGLSQ